MDINNGDILEMKKVHPCGNKYFLVIRSGMDFKVCCTKCSHEVIITRSKLEKNIKKILRKSQNDEL